LPFTSKKYLKAKAELWKLKYFTMQKCNLQKTNPLKETKTLSRYYNSIITNLKIQHKPKISSFKNPHMKRDLLLLLPRGQNPLSYYTLYNESKHNILALVGKANKSCSKALPIVRQGQQIMFQSSRHCKARPTSHVPKLSPLLMVKMTTEHDIRRAQ